MQNHGVRLHDTLIMDLDMKLIRSVSLCAMVRERLYLRQISWRWNSKASNHTVGFVPLAKKTVRSIFLPPNSI